MKLATKSLAAVLAAATLVSATPAMAGSKVIKEVIIEEEAPQWWNAALATGWDSLYMFRGLNVLPDANDGYGSSLYWTDLSVTFNLTENDFLTVGGWMAFGLSETDYKEFDAYIDYTHTWGNLSFSFGYIMYAILSEPNGLFSNELYTSLGYTFELGPIALTPSVNYAFNVGPGLDQRGFAEQASSYLEFRLDGSAPIYGDVVPLEPWVSIATNFRYNFTDSDDPPSPFTGGNNLEVGLALPIAVNEFITIAPYGAYSYQWNDIVGTDPSTFWGGGSVTFAF